MGWADECPGPTQLLDYKPKPDLGPSSSWAKSSYIGPSQPGNDKAQAQPMLEI